MVKNQDKQQESQQKATQSVDRLKMLIDSVSPGVELGKMAKAPYTGMIQFSPDRLQHTYILGKTGTGKSTLIKQMASQDLKHGRSITVIDPHGDVADYLVATMPKQRLRDVTFLDFSNTEYLPVINPLDVDPSDTTVVDRTIQDVITLLKNGCFYQFAGPRFESMARLGLKTLFDSGYCSPRTIVQLANLYLNEDFRDQVARGIKDGDLRQQWQLDQQSMLSSGYAETRQWFLSKFDALLNNSVLRRVLSGERSTVDVEQVITDNKVLIVRIPELVIGTDAADFLGTYIVSQLKNAVMRRSLQGADSYEPHYVYIDEFQRFASSDFATLLAESRKFKTGFILAHQNLAQLQSYNAKIDRVDNQLFETLLGNVGTLICLRMGRLDACMMAEEMGMDAGVLQRMEKHTAFVRLLFDNDELPPEQVALLSPGDKSIPGRAVQLADQMKKKGIWVSEQKQQRRREPQDPLQRLAEEKLGCRFDDFSADEDFIQYLLSGDMTSGREDSDDR